MGLGTILHLGLVVKLFVTSRTLLYPDTYLQLSGQYFNFTPNCEFNSSVFCNPNNYPDYHILKLLQENNSVNQLFDKEFVSIYKLPVSQDNDGEQDEDDLENVCSEDSTYIWPKAGRNSAGKMNFIVNSPDYKQLVQVTKCTRHGEEYGQGDVFSSSTVCVQKYLDHKLVVLSNTFSCPSCCICKVDKSY